jgi:hypothetical protein
MECQRTLDGKALDGYKERVGNERDVRQSQKDGFNKSFFFYKMGILPTEL